MCELYIQVSQLAKLPKSSIGSKKICIRATSKQMGVEVKSPYRKSTDPSPFDNDVLTLKIGDPLSDVIKIAICLEGKGNNEIASHSFKANSIDCGFMVKTKLVLSDNDHLDRDPQILALMHLSDGKMKPFEAPQMNFRKDDGNGAKNMSDMTPSGLKPPSIANISQNQPPQDPQRIEFIEGAVQYIMNRMDPKRWYILADPNFISACLRVYGGPLPAPQGQVSNLPNNLQAPMPIPQNIAPKPFSNTYANLPGFAPIPNEPIGKNNLNMPAPLNMPKDPPRFIPGQPAPPPLNMPQNPPQFNPNQPMPAHLNMPQNPPQFNPNQSMPAHLNIPQNPPQFNPNQPMPAPLNMSQNPPQLNPNQSMPAPLNMTQNPPQLNPNPPNPSQSSIPMSSIPTSIDLANCIAPPNAASSIIDPLDTNNISSKDMPLEFNVKPALPTVQPFENGVSFFDFKSTYSSNILGPMSIVFPGKKISPSVFPSVFPSVMVNNEKPIMAIELPKKDFNSQSVQCLLIPQFVTENFSLDVTSTKSSLSIESSMHFCIENDETKTAAEEKPISPKIGIIPPPPEFPVKINPPAFNAKINMPPIIPVPSSIGFPKIPTIGNQASATTTNLSLSSMKLTQNTVPVFPQINPSKNINGFNQNNLLPVIEDHTVEKNHSPTPEINNEIDILIEDSTGEDSFDSNPKIFDSNSSRDENRMEFPAIVNDQMLQNSYDNLPINSLQLSPTNSLPPTPLKSTQSPLPSSIPSPPTTNVPPPPTNVPPPPTNVPPPPTNVPPPPFGIPSPPPTNVPPPPFGIPSPPTTNVPPPPFGIPSPPTTNVPPPPFGIPSPPTTNVPPPPFSIPSPPTNNIPSFSIPPPSFNKPQFSPTSSLPPTPMNMPSPPSFKIPPPAFNPPSSNQFQMNSSLGYQQNISSTNFSSQFNIKPTFSPPSPNGNAPVFSNLPSPSFTNAPQKIVLPAHFDMDDEEEEEEDNSNESGASSSDDDFLEMTTK